MIRLYFLQAFYHLRENPIITWVSILGTAMAICMIMVLVITFQVRLVDCEPEVNRSRTLYVPYMSVKQKGNSDNESANASMSVRTGRECFRALSMSFGLKLSVANLHLFSPSCLYYFLSGYVPLPGTALRISRFSLLHSVPDRQVLLAVFPVAILLRIAGEAGTACLVRPVKNAV